MLFVHLFCGWTVDKLLHYCSQREEQIASRFLVTSMIGCNGYRNVVYYIQECYVLISCSFVVLYASFSTFRIYQLRNHPRWSVYKRRPAASLESSNFEEFCHFAVIVYLEVKKSIYLQSLHQWYPLGPLLCPTFINATACVFQIPVNSAPCSIHLVPCWVTNVSPWAEPFAKNQRMLSAPYCLITLHCQPRFQETYQSFYVLTIMNQSRIKNILEWTFAL